MRLALLAALSALPALAQHEEVFRRIEAFAQSERTQKNIPLIAVALVDDQKIIYQRTFGEGSEQTVFRVGSVSKLFTDLAVMQLVEAGRVDLDKPVIGYLPDFLPDDTNARRITLRQLMSHRAGLVREPPVGHYFDTSNPTLAQTVRSLNETALVYQPGRKTKYSNAGIAVAGRILEQLEGAPFASVLRRRILDPLEMRHSDFYLRPDLRPSLAKAFLWTYDGRRMDAPQFELGIAPAGSLYSTTGDLGRFLSALFRGGSPVVKEATLAKMWEPQFAELSGENFGLGFALGKMDGVKSVSHGGAIYGFATDLTAIPTEKLGVVVVVNLDSANPVATRIAQQSLRWLRESKRGQSLQYNPPTLPVPAADATNLAGSYGEGEKAIRLDARGEKVYMTAVRGGPRQELRWSGEDLMTDDLLGHGHRFRPQEKGLEDGEVLLQRQPDTRPAPCPMELRPYLGEYGWDHNVLYVLERAGQLTVLIEWYDYYPLQPVSPGVFRFPEWGLYDGELLTFSPQGARVGGVLFPRRKSEAEGGVFRIQPLKPVSQLRKEFLAATPPRENRTFRPSDLVELRKLDRSIKLDIRYATTDNFLGTPVYTKPKAFLQRPAAEAVAQANRELQKIGLGLLIHDGYRPWNVTKIFWEATPPDKRIFVADPSKGSRHNRGCAVDLTLYDRKTGKAVEMTGLYDEMTERSFPDYPGSTDLARWHRETLRRAMEKVGFRVFDVEWWHFDYKDWESYGIGNSSWDR